MFAWLGANLINIILILAVAALVFFCIRVMIRSKKAGKTSCGGSCASCGCACAGCCACRPQNAQKNN